MVIAVEGEYRESEGLKSEFIQMANRNRTCPFLLSLQILNFLCSLFDMYFNYSSIKKCIFFIVEQDRLKLSMS